MFTHYKTGRDPLQILLHDMRASESRDIQMVNYTIYSTKYSTRRKKTDVIT